MSYGWAKDADTHAQQQVADMNDAEETCEECGRANIVWFVDSDRWNLAVRKDGALDVMLCPSCFVLRWEKVTGLWACWRLVPENIRWPA
jgi:hypothetical protein